jgi:hypothetical protein
MRESFIMYATRLGLFVVAAGVFSAQAALASDTVATFADPSNNSASPLFTFNGAALAGSWNGLTLHQGAALGGATFNNASFVMNPIAVTGGGPIQYDLGAGSIQFYDSSATLQLNISFSAAKVVSGLTFGSNDFWGYNVVFSGPLLNGYTTSNETFSFAFANPVGTPGNYTATSSFTSSADLTIPAPGSAALLGLGGLLAARRRR